jgi:hypothetical protein
MGWWSIVVVVWMGEFSLHLVFPFAHDLIELKRFALKAVDETGSASIKE